MPHLANACDSCLATPGCVIGQLILVYRQDYYSPPCPSPPHPKFPSNSSINWAMSLGQVSFSGPQFPHLKNEEVGIGPWFYFKNFINSKEREEQFSARARLYRAYLPWPATRGFSHGNLIRNSLKLWSDPALGKKFFSFYRSWAQSFGSQHSCSFSSCFFFCFVLFCFICMCIFLSVILLLHF